MSRLHGSHNRHDADGPVTGLSEEDRIRANEEHDRKYGFSATSEAGKGYTNPKRRPEAYFGKLEDLWNPVDTNPQ